MSSSCSCSVDYGAKVTRPLEQSHLPEQRRVFRLLHRGLRRAVLTLLLGLIRGYQLLISPFLGGRCRYTPSCSVYAIDSLKKYGVAKGVRKAAWRVLRCNPFGGHGSDPP